MSIVCSNDKQRFAKECLYLSLLRLLEKKSFRDITVTELCEKAGLSRMAFYRNYSIIEDILEEHIEYDLCGGDLDEKYSRSVGLENILINYFKNLKENKKFVKLLVNSNLTHMMKTSMDKMVTKFSYLIPDENTDNYLQSVFVSSILALVIEWTKNDMNRPCEEMAALSVKLLNAILTCI